ncbi:chemotaxis response regulator protein-glutamate methylesterase [Pseudomonas aeruginosa]|uniref:chemotaxis protein CheB n=1 Tax=Pseudomonas aeruginosa TaxID=287 RepID=UPI000B8AB5DD|nr:chemotaxis protein CheB [Pseudomonas aeruginosa]OXR72393.1 chemotaxis response regulator protein-glutamate methylesterase [Pseudomonas aeruginosa]
MPISVLVVDDSALIRSLLKEIIQADPELRLVGCAPDAFVARDLIKQHAPDVISLDALLSTEKIIALGASTGGTEALKEVLLGLPAHSPGVVITQHMPPGFTRSFAERLDRLTRLSVSEARDGDRILPGHALVAPGDHHMEVQRSGANYVVRLNRQAQVNGHRPAVDVMFESLARCAGRNLLAGLLTGMGKDGARGLLAIRQAGGYTLAQDEATCVVYGMPREAVELGAAEDVLPLERIAAALLQQAARRGSGNRL